MSIFTILVQIIEVGVYPNSTTFLLDKLNVETSLEFNNYSDIDKHDSTGQKVLVRFLVQIHDKYIISV